MIFKCQLFWNPFSEITWLLEHFQTSAKLLTTFKHLAWETQKYFSNVSWVLEHFQIFSLFRQFSKTAVGSRFPTFSFCLIEVRRNTQKEHSHIAWFMNRPVKNIPSLFKLWRNLSYITIGLFCTSASWLASEFALPVNHPNALAL